MQCPRCDAILPDGIVYCSDCGTRQTEEEEEPPLAPPTGQATATEVADTQTGSSPGASLPQPAISEGPYIASGWAWLSGIQTPAPGGYRYPAGPHAMPPGFMPPVTPMPKRRGPWRIVTWSLSILILLLVFGTLFIGIGISIGQSHSTLASIQTVNQTQEANRLYQKVTSSSPTLIDSLRDGTTSQWDVYQDKTQRCEIKGDGLHAYIQDSNRFNLCSWEERSFNNFAFQVEMKMLSGDGGGLTFREGNNTDNCYAFFIYPNGTYEIFIEKNNDFDKDIFQGFIGSFTPGPNQKYTLTVIAQGSKMYFYVNRQYLTMQQDSTYPSGNLGVAANDDTKPADALFTNAQAWSL